MHEILKNVDMEKFREYCNEGDGHTIFVDTYFREMGFADEVVDKFVEVIKSNTDNHKETLFNPKGEVIPELKGVYGLRFLSSIARTLGADTKSADSKLGRGFAAREYGAAILKWLNEEEVKSGNEG